MFRVAFQALNGSSLLRRAVCAGVAVLLAVAPISSADAAKRKKSSTNNKYAAYVIDVKSGKVLFSRNGKSLRYPASLTKMMTLYMVFEQLNSGKLKLDSRMKVSRYASKRPPSKLGLRAGSSIKVRDAIYALVTKSANDVATVIAEHIGGTESNFGTLMTRKARSMGMSRTTFRNASGLPNSKQKTTAADMALLGRALQDRFPRYYKFFNTKSFRYGKRRYGNHNKLLGRVRGVDGIKTGYTRASGFNLVTNVKSRDRHIVAVVMGGKTGRSRDAHMKSLIAKYLPKAKTGRRLTALVVPRAGTTKRNYIQLASKIRLPKAKVAPGAPVALAKVDLTPVPAAAPQTAPVALVAEQPIANAPIQLAALPKARLQDNRATASIRQQPTRSKQLTVASLAIPPMPRPANDPIGDLSTHASAYAPAAATKSPQNPGIASFEAKPAPAGWQIQLGATPTLSGANKLLVQARKKNKRLLAAVLNHTETVAKNDEVLYRARFAGFSSKKSARRACKILKKQKFACLALNP
ncbi:D-alanyl-D-alanine carboxypeptidase [Cohaesibacter gelatinilyticus]|uniref:D-alanyl-D-alanine carboxypeptidase n=1 Tax=Cohaesibacter gelatinilyticus TaxID=372072 RepID=A0A285NKS9_9HYPH|nr:D-alanyl-D-alanine carboxypeptidase [Cohaesibacter gelatinilyticus]SNZ08261.1 D-alanyl-D-alanine carboxypeptidase [Cohaesibacter gelatinilyticus]